MHVKLAALSLFCLLVATISEVNGLRCYGCLASNESDCHDGVVSSFIHQTCEPVTDISFKSIVSPFLNTPQFNILEDEAIETVCISFTATEVIPNVSQRGCGYIYEGVDICDYLGQITPVSECKYCKTDLCNV